jgi:ACS family hexuronate transporter-like MFS transporter
MAKLRDLIAGHRRWLIVVLLAGFSVVNYLDRQSLSVLATDLRADLGMTTEQYSYILSVFLGAYAIGYGFAGTVLDRIGVKLGLALALALWSAVTMGHAAVVGWISIAALRFLLGLAQSFNAPGGMKGIAEWIPRRERGLSAAIFSNANSLGAVLAPPLVGTLALWLGWRWAFFITGASGCMLLIAWWRIYRPPERDDAISESERVYILRDRITADAEKPATATPYREILRDPVCVTLCGIRFLTDPFSYFISFWLIDYFRTVRGFSLETVALLGWLPFLASPFCGGPLGGALSDWLIRRGVDSHTARIRLMAAAACLTPLALLAVHTHHAWVALALSFVLIAANACWNVNKLTLASELVSRHHVASMVSLGGLAGSLGGVVSTLLAGKLIATVGYVPVFTALGFLHLTAFTIFAFVRWQVAPRMRAIPDSPK